MPNLVCFITLVLCVYCIGSFEFMHVFKIAIELATRLIFVSSWFTDSCFQRHSVRMFVVFSSSFFFF
jgi:hypothetical protein